MPPTYYTIYPQSRLLVCILLSLIPWNTALRAFARSRDGGVLTYGGATAVRTPDRSKRRDPGAHPHPMCGRFITCSLAFDGRERAAARNAPVPVPCSSHSNCHSHPLAHATLSPSRCGMPQHRRQRYSPLATPLVLHGPPGPWYSRHLFIRSSYHMYSMPTMRHGLAGQ